MQFCVGAHYNKMTNVSGHCNLYKPPFSDIPFSLKSLLFRDTCTSLTYINKQLFNKLPIEMSGFQSALFCHAFRLIHLCLITQ